MRARALLLALFLVLVPFRVTAEELLPLEDTTSNQVRMPVLVAPLVARNRLQGYVYLQVIIVTPSRSQAEQLSLKIPYLQDAFVREVHRASIAKDDDPRAIDGHRLKERLRAQIVAVAGPGFADDILLENSNDAAREAVNGPGELMRAEEKPAKSSGH
jgi:hypothetical protein